MGSFMQLFMEKNCLSLLQTNKLSCLKSTLANYLILQVLWLSELFLLLLKITPWPPTKISTKRLTLN